MSEQETIVEVVKGLIAEAQELRRLWIETEARVITIEDTLQRLTQALIAAPKPAPTQQKLQPAAQAMGNYAKGAVEESKPKRYFDVEELEWLPQTPTEKGEWEKVLPPVDLQSPFYEIVRALESAGKPLFNEGALYWLLTDRESGAVLGVGRRVRKAK